MCVLCRIRATTIKEIEAGGPTSQFLYRSMMLFDRLDKSAMEEEAVAMAQAGNITGAPEDLNKFYQAAMLTGMNSVMLSIGPELENVLKALHTSYAHFAQLMVGLQRDDARTEELAPAFTPLNKLMRDSVEQIKRRMLNSFMSVKIPEEVLTGQRAADTLTPDELLKISEHSAAEGGAAFAGLLAAAAMLHTNGDKQTASIYCAQKIAEKSSTEYQALCREATKFLRGERNNFDQLSERYQ